MKYENCMIFEGKKVQIKLEGLFFDVHGLMLEPSPYIMFMFE